VTKACEGVAAACRILINLDRHPGQASQSKKTKASSGVSEIPTVSGSSGSAAMDYHPGRPVSG
jgi:hypothetical protein